MDQPSIFLGNLRIDEPITAGTDVLVALVSWYAWYGLRKLPRDKISYFIRWFFFLMGTATFLGGILGHAFVYFFGFWGKVPGWLISMFGIMLLERAFIFYTEPLMKPGWVRFFYYFNIGELLIFMSLAVLTQNFHFVEYHTAYGLLVVVFGFTIFNWRKGRHNRFLQYAFAGVGLAIGAAVVFTFRLSFSPWFNHSDISHVLMALTAWIFYRGTQHYPAARVAAAK